MANKVEIIISALDETKAAFGQLTGSLKKMESDNQSIVSSIRSNWLGLTAAVYGAYATLNKALDFMELGAKAQQAEESFQRVTEAYRIDMEKFLQDMKRAANGTIDESDIMQEAIAGFTQNLKPDEIVRLMEVARIEARRTGDDVGQVFAALLQAVENNMPRGLRRFGLVTKEEMGNFEKAVAGGHTEVNLLDIILARGTLHMAAFGAYTEDNKEKIQRLKVAVQELKEEIGKFFTRLFDEYERWQKVGVTGLFVATNKENQIANVEKQIDHYYDMLKEASTKSYPWWKKLFGADLSEAEIQGHLTSLFAHRDHLIKTLNEKIGSKANTTGGNTTGTDTKSLDKAKNDLNYIDELLRKLSQGDKKAGVAVKAEMYGPPKEDFLAFQTAEEKKREASFETWYANDQQREKNIKDAQDLAAKEKAITEEDKANKINALETIKNFSTEYHLFRSQQLDELSQKMRDAGLDETDISRWVAEENKNAARESYEFQLQHADNFKDALIAKFNLMAIDAKSAYQSLADELAGVFDKMKGHLEGFFDYASDKFMDFGDLAQSILHDIYMAMVRAQIIEPIVKGVSGYFTPSTPNASLTVATPRHQGGIIPRFHGGGLNSDERLAINKVGERYITKEQNEWLSGMANKMNNNSAPQKITVKMENQSGVPLEGEQTGSSFDIDEHIVNVVIKKMRSSPSYRNAIGAGGLM
jgi:hypothetical protein